MAQGELSPVVKIKPVAVEAYVPAICALTGAELPVGEVTAPQMNLLIHALLNYAYRTHRRETIEIAAPE